MAKAQRKPLIKKSDLNPRFRKGKAPEAKADMLSANRQSGMMQ